MSESRIAPPRHQYEAFLQQLPEDWEQKEITQIGAVIGGGTPSREVPSFWRGSIPWVTPGEVSGEEAKRLYDTNDHISASGLAGSGANLLPAGSLLVTTRATLGARVINAVPMATNQGFKSIVFKTPEEASYYFHFFEKVKPELVRRASGTTFLEISGAEFGSIKVPSPSPDEKVKIADVLDTLDAAIHQTEAIVAKLKQVKEGLLHDLLTRGVDVNGELRPSYEDAPEFYQKSPLGWIPKDWTFGPFGSLCSSSAFGPRFPSDAYDENGPLATLRTTDMDNEGGISLATMPRAAIHPSTFSEHLLQRGDLVISRSGTCGVTGVFTGHDIPVVPGAFLIRFRLIDRRTNQFYRRYFNSSLGRPRLEKLSEGGVQKNIKGSDVLNLAVPILPSGEAEAIAERVVASEQDILSNVIQLQKLRQSKAGLTDDLLTGRVRVTNIGVARIAAGSKIDTNLLLSQLCMDLYEAEKLAVNEYRRELFGDQRIPELLLTQEGKVRVEIRKENVSHNAPHLHITHSDKINASISLLDFSILAGSIDQKTFKYFLKKLQPLKNQLLGIWNELNVKDNSIGAQELIRNLSL